MSEWKPIETAPLDGTVVDLWIEKPETMGGLFPAHGYRVADAWFDTDNWYKPGLNKHVDWDYATHWMPSPSRPEV